MFLPHPQFTVELVEAQNGHAGTIMDRCRPFGGTGQVRAATGERREAEKASFIRRVPADLAQGEVARG